MYRLRAIIKLIFKFSALNRVFFMAVNQTVLHHKDRSMLRHKGVWKRDLKTLNVGVDERRFLITASLREK